VKWRRIIIYKIEGIMNVNELEKNLERQNWLKLHNDKFLEKRKWNILM